MKRLISMAWLCLATTAQAAEPAPTSRTLERPGLSLHVGLPGAEGLRAFYTGRGFPAEALTALDDACFVNVGLRNLREQVVWIDLARWRAVDTDGKPVARISRDAWRAIWEAAGVPAGPRATFGWTLLPEQRDLRFDEPVAGNLTLARTERPFTLTVTLPTGADQAGEPIVIEIPELRCR
jgi:hypothetical protein